MQLQETVNFRVESTIKLHFGADVDYFEKLSHYSFGVGVVKLNKGIKVTELFDNALFN